MGLAANNIEKSSGGKQRLRDKMYEQVDTMVDDLWDRLEESDKPTVMEMSKIVGELRRKLTGVCLQTLIEEKYTDELDLKYAACPECGKRCKTRRKHKKELSTMEGSFELIRSWFYCTGCCQGFIPFDIKAEASRRQHQFDIQKKVVKLSSKMPFSEAKETVEDLTGQKVGEHFIHEVVCAVGENAHLADIVPSQEEIKARIKQVAVGTRRPIMVVASDGAHVPTRARAKRNQKRGKGRWQEAKGFRIYLVDPDGRIEHIASWHQIQNEEQFGKDLAEVAALIPQEMVRIALLGDGADWLWKHMTALFPKGRQILDYYHCVEHIYKVGKIQYGEKDLKGLEWVEVTITRLFYNEINLVIAGLRRMDPNSMEAKEEIRKLITYLDNNRNRIHYHGDRKGGYPIGSGGIESANKYICHTRMKRSGAWWVKENGNSMLRIRCSIYNGTYERVFDKYKMFDLSHR